MDALGTTPSDRSAMCSNAAMERSIELPFSQVGQASATKTLTDLPFWVLVMRTDLPQSEERTLVSP